MQRNKIHVLGCIAVQWTERRLYRQFERNKRTALSWREYSCREGIVNQPETGRVLDWNPATDRIFRRATGPTTTRPSDD
jgi:hypothetical protein